MKTSKGSCRLQALLVAAFLIAPLNALAAETPPDGTITETLFCGTIYEATIGMTNHGVVVDKPYIGTITLTQRLPDFVDAQEIATQWDCTQVGFECGEWRVTLGNFAPPQTEPVKSDVFGPVAGIDQTIQTYRLNADVDDFVTGPAALGATGIAEFEILCTDCGEVNNKDSIRPDFRDNLGDISGDIVLQMQVPGIGGSLAPPEGNNQDVRMSVSRLGGACNNILPATSSWGMIGLVSLMVATSVFFAGRKFSSVASSR